MKKHSWQTARFRRVTTAAALAFASLAVACDESTGPGGVVGVDVAVLPIGTPTSNIERGESVQLIAAPHDANDQFVNTPITWSSSNEAIATVDADGTVTGVEGATAGGDVTITATAGGQSGTFELNFQRPAGTVTISPATAATIRREGATTYTATVLDIDGNPAGSRTVNWTSSNTGGATVTATSTTDASGQATATVAGVADGTYTITATAENNEVADVSGTRDVIVSGAPLVATVTVSPSAPFRAIGQTVQFTHSSAAASGTAIPGTTATWSSSNAAVISVDPVTGLATYVGYGTASIRADVDNGIGTNVRGSTTSRSATPLLDEVTQAVPTTTAGESYWYGFVVPAGVTTFTITTTGGTGDGDIYVYNQAGTLVGQSFNSGNSELVTVSSGVTAGNTYRIEMNAWSGAPPNTAGMSITLNHP
jgi:adhesin/invasin